ncbi:MAG: MgtC/SapB family protein [Kiritimatiellae bacterium]|nr:MgtC/SapB family protein [Kiritimatiellia bacterium]
MLASLAKLDTTVALLGTSAAVEIAVRLLVASACGMLIGFEREMRAKEAGVRTHFLVSFGSALFMIISTYGFLATAGVPGIRGADQARIAAQIVSGIGFIGAGTIMVNRGNITGLTTAAGLWVAAGIGMAVGSGLYFLGLLATVMVLAGLEILRIFFHKTRLTSFVAFRTTHRRAIAAVEEGLKKSGCHAVCTDVTVEKTDGGDEFRVKMTLQRYASMSDAALVSFFRKFPNVTLDKIDSNN